MCKSTAKEVLNGHTVQFHQQTQNLEPHYYKYNVSIVIDSGSGKGLHENVVLPTELIS